MKKLMTNRKLAALVVGVLVVAVSLPFFAAFEAHVINVRAHIENALKVDSNHIDLGILFPNETDLTISGFKVVLSESFLRDTQTRVKDVSYFIRCKSKGEHDTQSTWDTPEADDHDRDYWKKHSLCPYFNVTSTENEGDTHKSANLDKGSGARGQAPASSDTWNINVPWVPPFAGYASQSELGGPTLTNDPDLEFPNSVSEVVPPSEIGADYGADLWIETCGFSYAAVGDKPATPAINCDDQTEWPQVAR